MEEVETWVAFVQPPSGSAWASTVSMYVGVGAEHRATELAQRKFCNELVGHIINEPPYWQLWEAARQSGFSVICTRIED